MYIVTVHMGTGSMVEGSMPEYVIGPFETSGAAQLAESRFYDQVKHNPTLRQECWCNTIQVPTNNTVYDAVADVLKRWDD